MRRISLLLAATALSTGCVDGLGLQSSCSLQMAQARAENGGGPPDSSEHDEDRGDHVEVWEFYDTGRRYVFRWGVSYDECQVERRSNSLSPVPLRDLLAR